jgi:alanyl-tRNA synthetase
MKAEKLIKKEIIKAASINPQKFYPTKTLEEFGLERQKCNKCGIMFWAKIKRDTCGDSACYGSYDFIENTPAKKPMEFQEVYFEFAKTLKKKGYTPIERFPVVARWRDDLDFNIASIVGFQPYVVKGEVQPPANPLTIPQICLRFGDIDNVGYTGRHHTGFTMIGQHTFQKPKNYTPEEYFKDWFDWYIKGMKIPVEELIIHEDAWAGGGNCGASLEVFSRGLELGNQVYMTYDMTGATKLEELKELDIKVLDMGMGQERCCWFSKGSKNSYEACMPKVCEYLLKETKLKVDWKVYDKFLPYSGNLNLDEIDDIDKEWEEIAKKIKIDSTKLRKIIEPIAGIYSIADHTRTLLYALTDGALPSNVKGGYNLRLILRRALDFITKFKWNIDMYKVMKLHAKELNKLYPELEHELGGIKKIIDIEIEKYKHHKSKVENKISNIIKKDKKLSEEDFIKYYISEGITPDEIKDAFAKQGREISIPTNFFTLVAEFFENRKISENKMQKNKLLDFVSDLKPTKVLYYEKAKNEKYDVSIIKEFTCDKEKYIVLDKTPFYPEMGGQASDLGEIGNKKIIDVIKVGSVIVHKVK